MITLRRIFGSAIVTVLIVCACVAQPKSTQPGSSTQPTTAPGTVVAEVAGKKLTYGQLQAFKKYFANPRMPDQPVIDQWKVSTVMAAEAIKEGLDKDPEIKAALEVLNNRLLSMMLFRWRQLNATVSDQEAREHYDRVSKTSSRYRHPAIVSVKLIVAKEREQLEAIKKRLVAGEDFDEIVNEYRDQTRQLTGLSDVAIKDVPRDHLRAVLGLQATVLEHVKLNEPIGPRRISKGNWAIFKVTDRKPGQLKPFSEVRDQIKTDLLRDKRRKLGRELEQWAYKQAGVEMKKRRMPPRPGPARGTRPRTIRRPTSRPAGIKATRK